MGSVRKESLVQWRYWGIFFAVLQSIFYSLDILLAKMLQTYGFFAQNSAFYRYTSSPIFCLILFFVLESRGRHYRAESDSEKGKATAEKTQEAHKEGTEVAPWRESLLSPIWPLTTWEKRKAAILVIAQGAAGPLSVICQHFAVEYLPVGDAVVISSSTLILVGILSHFLLKGGKIGVWQILTSICAVMGVVVISKPTFLTGATEFDSRALTGCAFSTASLCIISLHLIGVRSTHSVHFTIKVFILGCFGILWSFTLSQFTGGFATPVGLIDSFMLLSLSCAALANQIFFNLSLKLEKATLVSLVNTSDIIFAFIAQFIFLGVTPDKYSGIGGAIIFCSIFVMSFRKYLIDIEEDDHRLKKLFCILLY